MPNALIAFCYNRAMILVTGASGFIGRNLIAFLSRRGLPVRALLRPSPYSSPLPRAMPVEVAVSSLQDEKGVRAALKDVDCIFHLASAEKEGQHIDLEANDINGLENLLLAADQVGVKRIFYLSHIGADSAAGFPAFRVKAMAEKMIQSSRITSTIVRTSVVFGEKDGFLSYFARGLAASKFFYAVPGNSDVTMQPLWINDLIECFYLIYTNANYAGKIYEIGGGEYFSFRSILQMIMEGIGKKRYLLSVSPAFLRARNLWLGESSSGSVLSTFWIDYLAADRTCALDSLAHQFNILPGRFSEKMGRYLPKRSAK